MSHIQRTLVNCFMFVSVLLQEDCPFIVCMTYAFHTPDKLCFILDLMNGGDLHYHLSQHGVFNEQEMRFYAAEVILGKYLPNLPIYLTSTGTLHIATCSY